MDSIEITILKNLIHNDEYSRKVIIFINKEYFEEFHQKIIFEEVCTFIVKYNSLPTKETLIIESEKRTDITDDVFGKIQDCVGLLDDTPNDLQWLLDTTEKWCKDRAIYLALVESIAIADGNNDKKNQDAIPSILSDALAVSFDNQVGHDYLEDYEERYESYHREEDKIPLTLITSIKLQKVVYLIRLSTLLLLALVLVSLYSCVICAAATLLQGKNVLYVTLEMAEEKIAERIDANLLNVPIQDIVNLPQQIFEKKVTNLAKKTQGTLIIKEYPTASAHSGHFKSLLSELALKKSFKPDIIFIDYLNICASSRYKANGNVNSYSYIKAIAEELRGLAVEANLPIVSATQTTRSGYGNSDVDLTDTSESFGSLPATADLMFALISTEELESLSQIMVKQLKNRYHDPTINKRFVVGIDRGKMKLYDCEQSAQDDILDSGQEEEYNKQEDKLSKFAGLKF